MPKNGPLHQLLPKMMDIKQQYLELCQLVASPEIMADTRYLGHLSKRLYKVQKIYQLIVGFEASQGIEICQNTVDSVAIATKMQDILSNQNLQTEDKDRQILLEIMLQIGQNEGENCDFLLEFKTCEKTAKNALKTMYFSYLKFHQIEFCEKENCIEVLGGGYSLFKNETGIHSVSIDGKRADVEVYALRLGDKIEDSFLEDEVRVDIFHSGGPGGQNVNKVETAVRLTHLKTGIQVVCQDERSQLKNRDRAYKILKKRLKEFYQSQAEKQIQNQRRQLSKSLKKIRTYNFAENTVIDQKTGLTLPLDRVIEGQIDVLLQAGLLDNI